MPFLLLLIQDVNQWPVLGPTGTVIGLVLLVTSAIGNLLQARGMRWKGTAQAYESELVVVRERADREAREKADALHQKSELERENSKLHERTDLRPLQEQLIQLHDKVIDSMNVNNQRFEQALTQNTSTLKELSDHICSHSAKEEKAFGSLASAITAVEQRLVLGSRRSRAKAK